MSEREFVEMLLEIFGDIDFPAKRLKRDRNFDNGECIFVQDHTGTKYRVTVKKCDSNLRICKG